IACTRARERLVLTCADFDSQGKKLNRSSFFDHVQGVFPDLKIETWQPPSGFNHAEHLSEIIPLVIQLQASLSAWRKRPACEGLASVPLTNGTNQQPGRLLGHPQAGRLHHKRTVGHAEEDFQLDLFSTEAQPLDETFASSQKVPDILQLPELADVLSKARQLTAAVENQRLSPVSVESLHGRELATSVSALEDFAACPFKFFIGRGLRAEERLRFELDPRERGSFQHEVLNTFHN